MEQNTTAQAIETICSHCGGKLSYAPGTTTLKCEYCGTVNEIEVSNAPIEKLDLETYLDGHIDAQATMEVLTVKCNACSAETTFDKGVTAGTCAFCGNNLVVTGAATQTIIKPKSLLPFKIDRTKASEDFRQWINSLWWAPNDLKKYAQEEDKLSGIYLPFWTYDADTISPYIGERGIDYEVPVTRVVEQDGEQVEETVMEVRTEWIPVNGVVNNDFNDILVVGSRSLPQDHQEKLNPWDLESLTPFDERFISGFKAESYQVDVKEGWAIAQGKLNSMIEDSIRMDIGGNHQRIISYNTDYSHMTFKHVLLPIWISSYRFNNKIYRFIINGRTGHVYGERPYSWVKITLAVLLVIALLALIFGVFV